MIKIVRLPVGFSIGYKKEVGDSWVPVDITDLYLPDEIIHSVENSIKGLIKHNGIEITHFEYYNQQKYKFFKGERPCSCTSQHIDTLTDSAEIINNELDKLRELL